MSGVEIAASPVAFVQFAPQVAKYIFQAYKLWGEIKNVPQDMLDLVTNLKAYEPVFCEIESRFNRPDASMAQFNHDTLKMSFDCAKQAQMALEDMVRDLKTEHDAKRGLKRRAAALKVILKKTELEKLEKRLSQTLGLLQLALQMYQLALQSIANNVLQNINSDLFASSVASIVVKRLNGPGNRRANEMRKVEGHDDTMRQNSVVSGPNEYSVAYSSSTLGRFAMNYAKGPGAWHACIQLPRWLSDSVYEIRSMTSVAGWTYTYRTYNIIPHTSEVIRRIELGDKDGVLELFSARTASPFDRDETGSSLLHYAVTRKQPEICHVLLKLGLDIAMDEPEQPNRESPLSSVAFDLVMPNSSSPKLEQMVEIFRSFLRGPDAISPERLLDFVREFAYDDGFITRFRELFMPSYYSLPLRDRLEAIRLGAFTVQTDMTMRYLLSPDGVVRASDVSQSSREKLSLVHSAAVALGCHYTNYVNPYGKSQWYFGPYPGDGWCDLVTHIAAVANASDMHSFELVIPYDAFQVPVWRGTPLISVIGGVLCCASPDLTMAHWDLFFQSNLQRWLTDLQAAGVDLLEYGQREVLSLHSSGENSKGAFDADAIKRSKAVPRRTMGRGGKDLKICRRPKDTTRNVNYWVPIRIIDLRIGKKPEDWEILWAPEFEHMANEFWQLIEKQDVRIPGAWVD